MWQYIIIAISISIIIHGLTSTQQTGGGSSIYYNQRYPTGSWWIPFFGLIPSL